MKFLKEMLLCKKTGVLFQTVVYIGRHRNFSMRISRKVIFLCFAALPFATWAVLRWQIHNDDLELAKIIVLVPGDALHGNALMDGTTVAAYDKMGAMPGSWTTCEGGILWKGDGVNLLPGFEFAAFPQEKLPQVKVPFGLYLCDCNPTPNNLRASAP